MQLTKLGCRDGTDPSAAIQPQAGKTGPAHFVRVRQAQNVKTGHASTIIKDARWLRLPTCRAGTPAPAGDGSGRPSIRCITARSAARTTHDPDYARSAAPPSTPEIAPRIL